jgi:hypothetical protein
MLGSGPLPLNFALKGLQRSLHEFAERDAMHKFPGRESGMLGCDDLVEAVMGALGDTGV